MAALWSEGEGRSRPPHDHGDVEAYLTDDRSYGSVVNVAWANVEGGSSVPTE